MGLKLYNFQYFYVTMLQCFVRARRIIVDHFSRLIELCKGRVCIKMFDLRIYVITVPGTLTEAVSQLVYKQPKKENKVPYSRPEVFFGVD